MSPKVVVYVRADDARVIEALTGEQIDEWVRGLVRERISDWHDERARALGDRPMPVAWANHAEELQLGKDDDAS